MSGACNFKLTSSQLQESRRLAQHSASRERAEVPRAAGPHSPLKTTGLPSARGFNIVSGHICRIDTPSARSQIDNDRSVPVTCITSRRLFLLPAGQEDAPPGSLGLGAIMLNHFIHRLLAAFAALATLMTGLVLATAAPAQAVTTATNYGFRTSAYGSRVVAGAPGLKVERTAYSYLSCTRTAGRHDSNFVAQANLPAEAPKVHLSGVSSTSGTFSTRSGQVGSTSRDRIAKVVLGDAAGQHITIDGLVVRSRAWADDSGKLHASNVISSLDISSKTNTPLDDALNAADAGIQDLTDAIAEKGGSYTIPGLGTLFLGDSKE